MLAIFGATVGVVAGAIFGSMGKNVTQSTTKNAVKASIAVITDSVQQCQQSSGASNNVSILSSGSNVYYNGTFDSNVSISATCVSDNISRTSTSMNLATKANNTVKNISNTLQLHPNTTNALTLVMEDLSTQIVDQFNQNCITTMNTTNNVEIKAVNGSNVYAVTNFNDVSNSITNCIMSTNTVNKATDEIITLLTTDATNKVRSFMMYLVLLVVGIGAVIGAIILMLFLFGVIGNKKKPPPSTTKSSSSTTKSSSSSTKSSTTPSSSTSSSTTPSSTTSSTTPSTSSSSSPSTSSTSKT